MRWLFGSIADWDALYAEAFKTLKPGGWVESPESSLQVESDHVEIPDNSALGQWGKFFIEGGERMGRTCKVVDEDLQRKGMEAAGFVDIQVHEFKVGLPMLPISINAGEESRLTHMRRGLRALGLRINATRRSGS